MKFEGISYNDDGEPQQEAVPKPEQGKEYWMPTMEHVSAVMVNICSPIILQTRGILLQGIVEQSKLATTYSTRELITQLENSTSLDWNTKPGFYKALALEFVERVRKNKLR